MKTVLIVCTLLFSLNISFAQEVDAGEDVEILMCHLDEFTLSGSTPPEGTTGTWTQLSGLSSIQFSNPNDPNAQITNEVMGEFSLEWRVQGEGPLGPINEADTMQLLVYQDDQPAVDAGPDIDLICGNSVQMSASSVTWPSFGYWEIISGGATISNVNSPNSYVAGFAFGATTLRWTVVTSCGEIWDEVTINAFPFPLVDAGPDFEFCILEESIQLPVPSDPGPWMITWSGTEVTPQGLFTPSITGTYTLTLSYNSISNCSFSNQVVITVLDAGEACSQIGMGCTDPSACNFDNAATLEDGSCTFPEAGDLDCSGNVNVEDLLEIISNFGCISSIECAGFDQDGDGVVGVQDLLILVANM
jgi:hypothetical protein